MSRILTIVHLTFIEACRRKIVPAALLCSVLFLLVSALTFAGAVALLYIKDQMLASDGRGDGLAHAFAASDEKDKMHG